MADRTVRVKPWVDSQTGMNAGWERTTDVDYSTEDGDVWPTVVVPASLMDRYDAAASELREAERLITPYLEGD